MRPWRMDERRGRRERREKRMRPRRMDERAGVVGKGSRGKRMRPWRTDDKSYHLGCSSRAEVDGLASRVRLHVLMRACMWCVTRTRWCCIFVSKCCQFFVEVPLSSISATLLQRGGGQFRCELAGFTIGHG